MITPEQNLKNHIDQLLQIIERTNNSDLELVCKAADLGEKAHRDQHRKNGDLFFIHPVRVAIKATEYNLDTVAIIASLLHDVIEDTKGIKKTQSIRDIILHDFGQTVFDLVEAVTKVEKNQKLTLYKIFQLGNIDFRVIIIKLLDRLDNLSDLKYLARNKQRRICQETIAIYTEVAHGLGLIEIEEKIKDLVFKHLYPTRYTRVSTEINQLLLSRRVALQQIINSLEESILEKLLISITPLYIKPQEYLFYRKPVESVLNSILIMTRIPGNCYQILGDIHTTFRSIPLTIRDYISNPKANGWQGITTEVIINGEQIPIQIVTENFHENNRKGVLTLINNGIYQSENYKEFLQLYVDVASDNIRIEDVFRNSKTNIIQTLTPAGDVIELRYGATILDFAFTVHTELGLKSIGGIINNVRYPRNKILEDGMVVKILTSESVYTEKDWINEVVMPKSRKEILKHYKKQGNPK